MQKWRGMHKGLPDAPKRSRYRVRKGWHQVLYENSAKHPTSSSGKDSPKSGKTYRHAEDAEDSPTHIPFMRGGARHHYRTGWFRKFLMSRVGISWDIVYSDIRQGLDHRSGVQLDTLEQLLYWIETRCWIDTDGEMYSGGRSRPWPIFDTFFVHPDTGTLEYSGNTSELKYKRCHTCGCTDSNGDKISDSSDENNFLEKDHNGIWFAVRREEYEEVIEHGRGGGRSVIVRYKTRKMQLSTRELARCGLANEFMEFMKCAPLR